MNEIPSKIYFKIIMLNPCEIFWCLFHILALVYCQCLQHSLQTKLNSRYFLHWTPEKKLIMSDGVREISWHLSNNLKIALIVKCEKCLTCKEVMLRDFNKVFIKLSCLFYQNIHSQNLLHGLKFWSCDNFYIAAIFKFS